GPVRVPAQVLTAAASRGGSLRAKHAQQAVRLVVDAGREPERVCNAGRGRTGQNLPKPRLRERLAGGGVQDLAGGVAREPVALLGEDVDPPVTEVPNQQRAGG